MSSFPQGPIPFLSRYKLSLPGHLAHTHGHIYLLLTEGSSARCLALWEVMEVEGGLEQAVPPRDTIALKVVPMGTSFSAQSSSVGSG